MVLKVRNKLIANVKYVLSMKKSLQSDMGSIANTRNLVVSH